MYSKLKTISVKSGQKVGKVQKECYGKVATGPWMERLRYIFKTWKGLTVM